LFLYKDNLLSQQLILDSIVRGDPHCQKKEKKKKKRTSEKVGFEPLQSARTFGSPPKGKNSSPEVMTNSLKLE
jgi:hypothetical protein